MAADFFQHYGEALIAIPEFTIDNMSDDDATALIASYIQADREQVFGRSCPSRAALLPPIRFAPGEADIHVDREKEPPLTGLPGNQANAQRILKMLNTCCRLGGNLLLAPMPGLVTQVQVSVGMSVNAGDTLVQMEAMKMVHTLSAVAPGRVAELRCRVGDAVRGGDVLAIMETIESEEKQ